MSITIPSKVADYRGQCIESVSPRHQEKTLTISSSGHFIRRLYCDITLRSIFPQYKRLLKRHLAKRCIERFELFVFGLAVTRIIYVFTFWQSH